MLIKEYIDFKRRGDSKEALGLGRIMGIDISKSIRISGDTPPGFGKRSGKTLDGIRYIELVEKTNRLSGKNIEYGQKLYTGRVLYYEENPKGSWNYQFVKKIDYNKEK